MPGIGTHCPVAIIRRRVKYSVGVIGKLHAAFSSDSVIAISTYTCIISQTMAEIALTVQGGDRGRA